jgi:S-adenosylmethionine:tRNA-ribosyltransferase-isomerase (queuine synthetase)
MVSDDGVVVPTRLGQHRIGKGKSQSLTLHCSVGQFQNLQMATSHQMHNALGVPNT